ncbi:hypothetical protein EON79_10300 [bacterium]|nr:MAG: hypothetical protein EON79_10300 [bacterium]
MKRWLAPICALGVLAVGCSNPEANIPGTWSAQGGSVTFAKEKTWSASMGAIQAEGTWKMEGEDVILATTKVAGKTVAEIKDQIMKVPGAASNPQVKEMMSKIDQPSYYKVAADGKTMTTDKAKDKSGTPEVTLTKQAAK